MSEQEELAREIKSHNEALIRALIAEQKEDKLKSKIKNSDWSKNPIMYMVVMVVLFIITTYIQRKMIQDEVQIASSAVLSEEVKMNKKSIILFQQELEKIKHNFNTLEKILLVIRTRMSQEEDHKTWEELIEEYEKERKKRGFKTDSVYSSAESQIAESRKEIFKM